MIKIIGCCLLSFFVLTNLQAAEPALSKKTIENLDQLRDALHARREEKKASSMPMRKGSRIDGEPITVPDKGEKK